MITMRLLVAASSYLKLKRSFSAVALTVTVLLLTPTVKFWLVAGLRKVSTELNTLA